jgi:hypothetical protein
VNRKKQAYFFIVPSREVLFITFTYSTKGLKQCELLHTGAVILCSNQAAGSGLAFKHSTACRFHLTDAKALLHELA